MRKNFNQTYQSLSEILMAFEEIKIRRGQITK